MVNTNVYEKLIEIAKAKKTISYSEIATLADVTTEHDRDMRAVGLILDEIADKELAANRPLLPIVVVSGTDNMPGGGLFKYAKRKRLYSGDNLAFFAAEMKRVYEFWEKVTEH